MVKYVETKHHVTDANDRVVKPRIGGVQYDKEEKWTFYLDIVNNEKGIRNPLDDSFGREKLVYFPANKSNWTIRHHRQFNHYSIAPDKGKLPDELKGMYTDYMIAAQAIQNYLKREEDKTSG